MSSRSEFLTSSSGLSVPLLLQEHVKGGAAWEVLCAAQLLSGCHIPRWHVVTGSSGHACCKKNRQTPNIARVKVRARR